MDFNKLPYYEPSDSLKEQVKHSSTKRDQNIFGYVLKKARNHILERIALHNPINSIRVWSHRKRGVDVGEGVMIGMGCVLDHAFPEYIKLEDNSSLAGNDYLVCHSNPYSHFQGKLKSYVAPIVVKEGAWITVNVTILPGVTIGKNSVVSAGSVVTKDVPPNTIVRGNPAKVIKKLR